MSEKQQTKNKLHLGIDVGSISVNIVILDNEQNILKEEYLYCHGKPFHILTESMERILEEYGNDAFDTIAFTGSGGKKAAELTNSYFVNEIIAQSASVAKHYPEARTVIEMGGEDSKLIFMDSENGNKSSSLSDFSLNSLCAAGTGSFLDQQAKRIGVSIEKEFGELALKSENPPRIAGRCSVFAKSDMIHLQQIATPLHDIVAGLCFAVARNLKSTLGRGKTLKPPFVFQGGVAANKGMQKAFTELLKKESNGEDIIIPEHYASMGALGALYYTLNGHNLEKRSFEGISKLKDYLVSSEMDKSRHKPLVEPTDKVNKEVYLLPDNGEKTEVFLGLDIGSLSTNLVLIDKDNNVIARQYLATASKPLNAIQLGLKLINESVGDKVKVVAAGTTGSGRYLTGDFIGADTIQNEITAQATAAIAIDPEVDTIFEIGGQDSKYISIDQGVIVDFEMNKVCAAGTGSFLEEQAEKLDINIKEDFQDLALKAENPVTLGDRCTVFMESDLNSFQQKGAKKENLVGGLAYSIVQNYLQKVVCDRRVGNKIFFQGGVANNKSVVAAFNQITGKKVEIPPHFDVTGAIGAAILARREMSNGRETNFKGFDVHKTHFNIDRFECKSCSNNCEIQRVKIEDREKVLYYGGRCEKYEKDERKSNNVDTIDYIKERVEFINDGYKEEAVDNRKTVGIPRALMVYYQQFPFWQKFFTEMGFRVVLSDKTNQKMVIDSLSMMVAETCLPVELVHGHVNNLINKETDYIFMPFIVNNKGTESNPTNNCNCPWVQAHPYILRSAFTDEEVRKKFLTPTLHLRFFDRAFVKELSEFMFEKFGISKSKTKAAIEKADQRQVYVEKAIKKRGKEVIESLPADKKALVIMGRPYNTGDPFQNLRLAEKLIKLNTVPIPLDYMPLEEVDIFDEYPMMYWPNGQKIMSAARIISQSDKYFGVYLSNFRCGPDSFISHFVKEEMAGQPYLHLEVDEHSADAGLITRCEAFLDSLDGYLKTREKIQSNGAGEKYVYDKSLEGRTLYYPYASDQVHIFAAASRSCGISAEVLPMQDEEDLEIARKYTTGQECFPMICTTGSFVKKLLDPETDPEKAAFFMPDHNGPCRFGEYNKLQRIIFDKLGFDKAGIISPSNENSYAELAQGNSLKFRFSAWKGIVALDLLRKLLQEKRPYEANPGEANSIYKISLERLLDCIESGAKGVDKVVEQAGKDFAEMELLDIPQKPIIAVVGEIFMRDNPFCSNFIIDRLEQLGAETLIAPFGEWLHYSTYRYYRDSKWKGNLKGMYKSRLQAITQHISARRISGKLHDFLKIKDEVEVKEMLQNCLPYIHKDYDGDPALSLGTASILSKKYISGIMNILPFTCMPGTILCAASNEFSKDHKNIPWFNFAYDGQEDAALEMRLQAFMYQVENYHKKEKENLLV